MFEDILNQMGEAAVGEQELNPLGFRPEDYTSLDEVLAFMQHRERVYDISLEQLSLNGQVVKDPMQTYLSTAANSSSALKEVLKTPLHYWCYLHEPQVKRSSKAFELGTFCHTAFLEPEQFDKVIIEPQASRSTKEGIAKLISFWEAQAVKVQKATRKRIKVTARRAVAKAGLKMDKIDGEKMYLDELERRCGLTVVSERDYHIIQLIKRHYYNYGGGIIPELLKGAAFETSFYGKDAETGLPVKVRPDAFNVEENVGANIIVSFKTTSADSIKKFAYDAAAYQYHLSEAMYLEVASQVTGRKFSGVVCIMLQTTPPFLPAVLWYRAEDLANGRYRYRNALSLVKDCYERKSFPGFDALAGLGNRGIIEFELPEWSLKELTPAVIE